MVTNVLEYLEASERRSPDKTAYADQNGSVTFHEFADRARRLGSCLARRRIVGKPVAVFMDKSVAMIEGFMGAVYSGSFYCPIDVEMPAERIRTILGVLKPAAVLVSENSRERAQALLDGLEGNPAGKEADARPQLIVAEEAYREPAEE